VVQCVRDPQPECRLREEHVTLAEHIQLWVPVEDAGGDKLVEDTYDQRREDSEDHVVQGQRPRLVGDLAGEVVEERILIGGECQIKRDDDETYPELGHVEHNVLVERVCEQSGMSVHLWRGGLTQDQLRQPAIAPCTVDKQQLLQEPELRDREVGRACGLQALQARDTDADVRGLDHTHVIGAVADRE
jgi:hypothetical protein